MPPTVLEAETFAVLHEIAQLLSSALGRDAILQQVMDAVIAVTGAERGFILLQEAGKGFQVAAARNFEKEAIQEPSFNVSRTVIDVVVQTGESQVIDDAMTDSRTSAAESVSSLQLRSIIGVPLKVTGRVVGVLYLDHRSEMSKFGPDELKLLETIAHQASAAVRNARLTEQAAASVKRLEELKAYHDSVLSGVSTAIIAMDTQGRVQTLNQAAGEIFQVSEEESRGHSFRQLLGDQLANQLLPAFRSAVGGQATPATAFEAAIGDTQRYFRCSVAPQRDGAGAVTSLLLLVDDDTPKVAAEKARQQEEIEHRKVRELFGKYVPEAVVNRVIADPKEAEIRRAVQREISVLFADIRGYTTISEKASPERLVVTLSRYLKVATDAIVEQHGTLDKFMGDGVMAVFNAPTDLQDHALYAVRAGWAMQRRAARFMEGVSFGVGVNTGPAIVGNIGTEQIGQYSCVGDTVNVASRLQGHAEGGHMIITRGTYNLVRGKVQVKPLGAVPVKGRAMAVEAFQVIAVN
ncbi:MAG TPA: adenylate/guanylate cyclase domain-containing protein [Chloroflexota bacterium]|nr:adenylate/guanylate cyclase domain-containing protein [Chloroflexota bacterium]